MTARFACFPFALLALVPALAFGQESAPSKPASPAPSAAPAPQAAPAPAAESRRESQSNRLSTNIGGFIAIDVFKWVKVEDRRNTVNLGIGTLNLDAHARYGNTRLKFKLDLDGDLATANNIFEEAFVTQEFLPELSVTIGKGIVPFHQKHYGVITDSYIDGGTRLGRRWTFGDQDRKLLTSVAYGNKSMGFRNSLTFFGDSELQVRREGGSRNAGNIITEKKPSATGKGEVDVPTLNKGQKGFDPFDQRGAADKVEVFWTPEFSTAVGGLLYWNRLDPHLSQAVVTSGKYEERDSLEIWYELQYGWSSSFQYQFKNRDEYIAQVGAEYYLDPMFSVLANVEVAKVKSKDLVDVKGSKTFDFKNAQLLKSKATLAKAEAGVATHFSDRATWTNGFLYERGSVKRDDLKNKVDYVKVDTEENAYQIGSSFTFAF